MDISEIHKLFLESSGVCTDTRRIEAGCLFVALKGDNFDANSFAAEALEKGAAYAVIDNPSKVTGSRTILVEDGLSFLQQLANFHRNFLALPVIALTGSNGKTTTKELIHAVLSQKFKTSATIGNLNNHIGVPLTILKFTAETQLGIVEMGANHQREISQLCAIAEPDFGYITNFGKAHLEGFGGVEGVIKGKSELYDYLRTKDKLVFVNSDDSIQMEKSNGMHRCTFGKSADSEVKINSVVADPYVSVYWEKGEVDSNLIGLYNATNVGAAIAIGNFFGLEPSLIGTAIAAYIPNNNRSQILEKGGNKIILDAYNANPSSMDVAISNFVQLSSSEPKVMFLGDMFELGNESDAEHLNLVQRLADISNVEVHLIGPYFYAHKNQSVSIHFHNSLASFLETISFLELHGKNILIKGSRGMALERILDHIS
ncbi:UDP-N-acetylmuramoyl-tripeptide--D-alanyl-D-alanine ligase [Flavobacterium silvaticum]|uniref:UDP-N-acetylmuramoyl-tripeptide--D-alanyl-D-alanine ligase n=1 Tax=Flavobacterium silvaticum TaxID=1852020 RepID=A0A972JL04_9FLAO|nr:UDP-N-acetylmuramoyl-tripeptide--D-alanyl-D-alanine ligase [Flavobacterium silvaticum]NMH29667.1 UDP-N-acetylmuramoyl-tripeptide--D-alanyl-D-alanine ligase [Flavobacterium silvaticum]